METKEFLEHHGVMGMKWGVRRKNSSGSTSSQFSTKVGLNVSDAEVSEARAALSKGNHQHFNNPRAVAAGEKSVKEDLNKGFASAKEFDTWVKPHNEGLYQLFLKDRGRDKLQDKDVDELTVYHNVHLPDEAWNSLPNHERYSSVIVTTYPSGKHSTMEVTTPIKKKSRPSLLNAAVDVASTAGLLAMSDSVDEFFAHHGILGMKWGVRRSPAQLARATPRSDGKPAWQRPPSKESKSTSHPSGATSTPHGKSNDQVIYEQLKDKARKHGINHLSNDEIRVLTTRAETLKKANATFPQKKSKKAKLAKVVIDDILLSQGQAVLKDIAREQFKKGAQNRGLLPKPKKKTTTVTEEL